MWFAAIKIYNMLIWNKEDKKQDLLGNATVVRDAISFVCEAAIFLYIKNNKIQNWW
jgi:hypothetical protein